MYDLVNMSVYICSCVGVSHINTNIHNMIDSCMSMCAYFVFVYFKTIYNAVRIPLVSNSAI